MLSRHRAPFGARAVGSRADYLRLWDQARREEVAAIDEYEQSAGAAIDPEWFHRLALTTQVTIKPSAICYHHGRLLYSTLRTYLREHPDDELTVLETGTARGFGTLCMARALSDAGAHGKIVTFDVLPHDQPIMWNCIRDVEGPHTRSELLADYADLIERYVLFCRGDTRSELPRWTCPRVHFAFLDSVHTYEHLMSECAAIRGRQKPGDVLFFDDYTARYPGVMQAADEVCLRDGYRSSVVRSRADRAYLIAEKQ